MNNTSGMVANLSLMTDTYSDNEKWLKEISELNNTTVEKTIDGLVSSYRQSLREYYSNSEKKFSNELSH